MFPDNTQTQVTDDGGAPTFSGAPAAHMTPVATNNGPFGDPTQAAAPIAADNSMASFTPPTEPVQSDNSSFSMAEPAAQVLQNSTTPTPVADLFSDDDGPSFLDDHAAPSSAPAVDDNAASGDPHISDDLLKMKQDALEQLEPLVDKLDQTPEEAFKTTMMMIQATDNQSLLSKAYQQAQKIDDEKVRAQALLDVINEINYFSSNK